MCFGQIVFSRDAFKIISGLGLYPPASASLSIGPSSTFVLVMCYVAEGEALLIPCQAACLCGLAGVTYCCASRGEERLHITEETHQFCRAGLEK